MTDGPRKPRSPARLFAVGCGVSVAAGAVIAVFAAILLYKISKEIDGIAKATSDWLALQPEAQAEFGSIARIDSRSHALDVQSNVGWFEFQVSGSKASGQARVTVVRREGEWRAVGARLTVGDRGTTFGTPP